ncbi:LysR substrate-binding domain-containing protein [Herbiconiux sp. A18JL235]|uniref:LysR substrate-binding domain-containing protein n=1 Tax=Herbiconiux sp. A18JL235 TaxID=3152363 RepID=A0AB39BK70_9MICO
MRSTALNLRQLECFLAVTDAGSIALAATELHTSESAVSAAVSGLEKALGVQLLVRRRAQGVTPTASGRLLRQRARVLLDDAVELEIAVSGGASSDGTPAPLVGSVTIGCAEEMAPVILPPIIERLATEQPGVTPLVEIGLEESFWPRLLSGEIDLAVTLDHRQPTELEAIRLKPLPLNVVLPAEHPLARLERITPAELADEDWIMLSTEPGATHSFSMFNAAGVTPKVRLRTPSHELARSLVGRGLGYTLHIHRPFGDVSQEGRALAVRPLVTSAPVEWATLAWSAETRPSPWARAVIGAATRAWPGDAGATSAAGAAGGAGAAGTTGAASAAGDAR